VWFLLVGLGAGFWNVCCNVWVMVFVGIVVVVGWVSGRGGVGGWVWVGGGRQCVVLVCGGFVGSDGGDGVWCCGLV